MLEVIGRRIKKTGYINSADKKALANMLNTSVDMQHIIDKLASVTAYNIEDMKPIFTDVLQELDDDYKDIYKYRDIKPIPIKKNERALEIINKWITETAGNLINISKISALGFVNNNGVFQNINEAFNDSMDSAVKAITEGTVDFHSAMRKTVKDLGGSGVRVNYGSGVTRALDNVVRQGLLYGTKQACQDYQKYIGDKLGCDIFFVDYHPHSRPSHEFMGGKAFSYGKGFLYKGQKYPDGAEALARLEDYGCLHFKTDGISGVSENPYNTDYIKKRVAEDKNLIEYDGMSKTKYEWQQKQRLLERTIRQQKDTAILAKSAGDTELYKQCKTNIKAYKKKYFDLCDNVGIESDIKRASVVGFR